MNEKVKKTISNIIGIRLMPKKKVADSGIAYLSIGDIAKTYTLRMEELNLILPIGFSMLDKWRITVQQLDELASRNAAGNQPYRIARLCDEIKDISGLFPEMSGDSAADEIGEWEDRIKIVNFDGAAYGAAAICYPEVLEEIAEQWGDTWVIPSSVHEVLVMKDEGRESLTGIEQVIVEINEAILAEENFLSDKLYHYHPGDKQIETGSRWEQRKGMIK